MSTKCLIFLLCVFLVFTPVSAKVDEDSVVITIDSLNTSRGENKTVLYDSSYGASTNTNEWGVEIVVTNGIVTSVEGFNNTIPVCENSFVLSGHGTAGDALRVVTVGMRANYNSFLKTVSFTVDNTTYKMNIDIARANAILQQTLASESSLVVSPDADLRFDAAEKLYASFDDSFTESDAQMLIDEYTKIASLYREREVSSYRAIWLTPTQKNHAEVEHFVRRCAESGINMISVELFVDCTMICPMPEDSYFEHCPDLNGFDLLDSFVTLSHKYNIELHCWMPSFRAGATSSKYWQRSIGYKKTEWQLISNKGSNGYSGETHSEVFLNPALEEVRDHLAETYAYILKNYDIDGIQLDFIRYKAPSDTDDFGYDPATIAAFKEKYPQFKESDISFDRTAPYWQAWVDFRALQVSKFVQLMHETVEELAPEIILSADVGAVTNDSYNIHYQDSKYWLDQNWLDMIHPMAYGEKDSEHVKTFLPYMSDSALMVPILGIYKDEFDAMNMLDQTTRMYDVGAQGIGYFAEEGFFSKNCDTLLRDTLFTSDSIAPSLNNATALVAHLGRFNQRLSSASVDNILSNELIALSETAVSLAKTDSASSASDTLEILLSRISALPETSLKSRLMLDVKNAYSSSVRDTGDIYTDITPFPSTVPIDAVGAPALTIDKLNSIHRGEDSVLITDVSDVADYNTNFAYVMLLSPVPDSENSYILIEANQNYGTPYSFSATLTEGMLVASFHTDDFGSGLARRNLARSIPVGTRLSLHGVDVVTGEYTSLYAMLYIPQTSTFGDVDGNGDIDQFDYLLVKRAYFDTYALTDEQQARADVDSNGQVDQLDYLYIKRYYFGTYVIGQN